MKVLVLRSLIIFTIFNLFTLFAPKGAASNYKANTDSGSKLKKFNVYSVEKLRYTRKKSRKINMYFKKFLGKIQKARTEIASECLAFGEEMKKSHCQS